MFGSLCQHFVPIERRTDLVGPEGVHHWKWVSGGFDTVGVELLNASSMIEDHT